MIDIFYFKKSITYINIYCLLWIVWRSPRLSNSLQEDIFYLYLRFIVLSTWWTIIGLSRYLLIVTNCIWLDYLQIPILRGQCWFLCLRKCPYLTITDIAFDCSLLKFRCSYWLWWSYLLSKTSISYNKKYYPWLHLALVTHFEGFIVDQC